MDALYLKVRHEGTVESQAVLITYGVNLDGRREILGSSVSLSEAEIHWREFLESLLERGLRGVKLITSDDHSGLRAALNSVFPSVLWQRCQFHMMQNAQNYAPKKHMKEEIVSSMRHIFKAPTLASAHWMIEETVKKFEKSAPQFIDWLEKNILEGLTCFHFPESHQKKIRTSNGMERINREIRRRTKVAVLFPNKDSALRLVTAILMDIHEDWMVGPQYLNMDELNSKQINHNFKLKIA